MLEEYRHPDLFNSSSSFLELDYFFPKLKLALEFQVSLLEINLMNLKGLQHFQSMDFLHNTTSIEERKQTDSLKTSLCKKNGTHNSFSIIKNERNYTY